ncbi:ABC transporter permease protein [Gottschalkia purinilytica]|uniref:ABC transporter permease protein n=1 Tax=Gottschalkia purinilytica TaxID=1503 RepID=A0A0L0WDV0_GOTPU|nr:FtsX-like permease family protein [Gottschalkia purinilytica]KNF09595.1 ABC transporter permease protein [Gottschalkia purinilytica]
MKLHNITINNMKGNAYRYVMYYLSNTLTVAIFFIFSNFVFYPKKITSPSEIASRSIDNGLIMCQVIIVMFSLFFVTYSVSIFLKSREREFGLLSLFGMTKNQIRKYVLIESTIISSISIVSGIILGILFSRLFFLIIGALLQKHIIFGISFKATKLTLIIFLLLFQFINIVMLIRIKNKEIIEQIKSNKVIKEVPTFSIFKSLIGITLLIVGYVLAWNAYGVSVISRMIPVTLIVIAGTYFIFTQFSILLTNLLKKNITRFYTKTNIVAVSQMIFKLKDTAKVLFLASILGAITFTATETVYSLSTEFVEAIRMSTPDDVGIVNSKEDINRKIDISEITSILEKYDLKVKYLNEVKGVEIKIGEEVDNKDSYYKSLALISNSQYNKLAKQSNNKQIRLNKNEIIYTFPFKEVGELEPRKETYIEKMLNKNILEFKINDTTRKYNIKEKIYETPMNTLRIRYSGVLSVNDIEFEEILKNISKEQLIEYYGIKLEDGSNSYKAVKEIRQYLNKGYEGHYSTKADLYIEQRSSLGVVMFIGLFIALLFLIASGSIIYFKLFNDMKQDSMEYSILRKIGASKSDIRRIITKQIAIIFSLPFIVSTSHSLFALKALGNFLQRNLLINGLTVIFGYFLVQLVYFLIVRKIYIRKIDNFQ